MTFTDGRTFEGVVKGSDASGPGGADAVGARLPTAPLGLTNCRWATGSSRSATTGFD